MSVVVELVGQELEDQQGAQVFHVYEVAFASTAYALVKAVAPAVWAGLLRQTIRVQELGAGTWKGEVAYGTREPQEQGSVSWSFSIATQSVHITQAIYHVADYPTGTAPNHQGAIGVRDDGNGLSVEGCEVVVPVFTWEETHYLPAALVASQSWLQTMESLTAKINNDSYRMWARGELLFLGVSGQHANQSEKDVPVTFRFASSRTRTNFSVGPITGVTKEGHHYLWIEYEPHVYGSGRLIKRPKAVHIERVYDYADFDLLGIDNPWS